MFNSLNIELLQHVVENEKQFSCFLKRFDLAGDRVYVGARKICKKAELYTDFNESDGLNKESSLPSMFYGHRPLNYRLAHWCTPRTHFSNKLISFGAGLKLARL